MGRHRYRSMETRHKYIHAATKIYALLI